MSNLQSIRKKRGLSQSELARDANVSVRMIQNYEQGTNDINKAEGMTLYKISKVLHCLMEDLLEI